MPDRNTMQKAAVHKALCEMKTHPTAAMVYDRVHQDHPGISRSTVYRILARMAEEGKILRLELGGSDSRYDGQTRPHSHVHCRVCGAVADLPAPAVAPPSDTAGYLLEDWAVVYRGLCPSCRLLFLERKSNQKEL